MCRNYGLVVYIRTILWLGPCNGASNPNKVILHFYNVLFPNNSNGTPQSTYTCSSCISFFFGIEILVENLLSFFLMCRTAFGKSYGGFLMRNEVEYYLWTSVYNCSNTGNNTDNSWSNKTIVWLGIVCIVLPFFLFFLNLFVCVRVLGPTSR